jgi:AraC-like DNA-binding protein
LSVLADTSTVHARESLSYWNDAISRGIYPVRVERAAHGAFRGRAASFRVGPLGLLRIETDATTVVRTDRDVSAFDPELLQVALMRRGRCVLEQSERRARLAPGDIALYDTSRVFRICADQPYEMLVYTVPRTLLGAHAERLRGRVAVRVPADAHLGGLGGRYLRDLADLLESGDASAGDVDLADGALALIRAMYTVRATPGTRRMQPAADEQIAVMKGFIEERLGDPRLGPREIARAHHRSSRYVHQLFAQQGETVGSWIRSRRLDRCRRDLQDPHLAHEAVSNIAARWGFTNHTSFSRVFRATFGQSPSQVRSTALAASARD